MSHADVDAYLPLKNLSRVGGASVRTLRDWIHAPTDPLPAYRVRGKILVRLSEFHAWMARRRYSATTVDGIVEDVLRELAGPAGMIDHKGRHPKPESRYAAVR